jgi:hypothetical protein
MHFQLEYVHIHVYIIPMDYIVQICIEIINGPFGIVKSMYVHRSLKAVNVCIQLSRLVSRVPDWANICLLCGCFLWVVF